MIAHISASVLSLGVQLGICNRWTYAIFRRFKAKLREAANTSWVQEHDLLKSLDFSSVSTKREVMHWISTTCIELDQDETTSTQPWKNLQPVFGPTCPEVLAAANAEHEEGLLFATDTVIKEI